MVRDCRAHKVVGNLAYGECWGNTLRGYHAFCLAYCEGEIKILEPQNDDTKDWKKSDYKPDFIKICAIKNNQVDAPYFNTAWRRAS